MRIWVHVAALAWVQLAVGEVRGQAVVDEATPAAQQATATVDAWAFSLVVDGYIVPHGDGFVNPTLTADHTWLHLEARYNYENLDTGSLWVGYNFSAGERLALGLTPMLGGVFGRSTGIAPGCEAALTYAQVELSVTAEYVFDTSQHADSFFYAWPELTYAPLDWLRVGLAAQNTKAIDADADFQGGFLLGLSSWQLQFTTYVFEAWADPTVILETGIDF